MVADMQSDVSLLINKICDRVRAERKSLGLSQEEFAIAAGIAFRTFKRFECGSCDSLEVLVRVAMLLEERTGRSRLNAFDDIFPGVSQGIVNKTPLGALQRLLATRNAVVRRVEREAKKASDKAEHNSEISKS
ncbi:hypothetical protein GCM10011572_28120 [Pseudoduganella buxea]|uniref:HTH cro/C1-type domain-containing protein n=1 Tax=Pseudoduganella buxea TaxID=1949069 RepID=A0ABQ1KQI5_9BURK|nr:hypothetical protein GCM10011572_28120 [Pseudoduganella buxea]